MSATAFPIIAPGVIGGALVQTVNARDLHAFLKVGRVFGAWIQGRIAKYGFVENADYVTAPGFDRPDRGDQTAAEFGSPDRDDQKDGLSSPNRGTSSDEGVFSRSGKNLGGRPAVDYHLTMDMAKELSMVENNAQGRAARRYFIDCERRAKVAEAARMHRREPDDYAEIPLADNRRQIVAECRRIFGRRPARRLWLHLGMPGVDDEPEPIPHRLTLYGDERDGWCLRIVEAVCSANEALSRRKVMIRASVSPFEFDHVIGRLEMEGLVQSYPIGGERFYRKPDGSA